jgi:hypothetical protein
VARLAVSVAEPLEAPLEARLALLLAPAAPPVAAVSKSRAARRAAGGAALALLALGCGGGAAVPHDAATASDAPVAVVDAADGSSAVDAAVPPAPYPRPGYQHLSETGLYSDMASLAVDPSAILFEPGYKLWSDGATKRRWLRLPPGTKIDTSDMDHWIFPIGTQFWKEFSLDGVLLETRLVERYGTGPDDYWLGAFVWNAGQTEADLAPDGLQNIAGTMHDAPAQKDCGECHRGDAGRVLGFSAIQLSAASTGPNLQSLSAAGLLSHPPAAGGYPLSADPATAAALGYLHANCGHCHNQNGTSWPDTQMVLRSVVADTGRNTSAVYRSIVNVPLQYWRGGAITVRVAPGQPDGSAIVARMSARGNDNQMPPLATELVDGAGLDTIRQWISGLPL